MKAFVTPKQMAALDKQTMSQLGIRSWSLMDRVTDEMSDFFKEKLDPSLKKILVLCGPGNNGGDGYCLAEKLRKNGCQVWTLAVCPPRSPDCKKAARLCRASKLTGKWPKFDIVVDAVFGCFARADLDQSLCRVLQKVNRLLALKISLDVPTGIDTQKAKAHPTSFKADITLCVAFPKTAFIHANVAEYLGRVEMIGNYFVRPKKSKYWLIEDSDFSFSNQKRTRYKQGRCGILAGSPEMPGASFLAAEAAHRVGSGYVTLFFAKKQTLNIKLKQASFLFRQSWKFEELKKQDALVVGPGGLSPQWKKLKNLKIPQVFDAEVLRVWNEALFPASPNRILTPHPGEAAQLLKCSTKKLLKGPESALEALVEKTGQSVYLKTTPGLLAFSGEAYRYYVNLSINPIFAKGGSGDVLSGIMGGFLAQRPAEFKNCIFSALIFQRKIGEILRQKRASIASDQLEIFSQAFRDLKV